MKKCLSMVFGVVLGSVIMLGNVPWVHAQDADEFTLDEITVTAQKREENQQKVAATMEVITGDDIKEFGMNDIEKVLSTMSSVIVNKASDGLRISLRGISDDEGLWGNVQASTPTVSVNQDGVFSDRKDSGRILYDVERVEVLVGPQSTLYASNTPGGVVNIVTGQPNTEKYEASGTLEYGSYNALRTEGTMNAPVSDTMAVRAAFSTSVHDGYLSNGGDDEDLKSARLKVLYRPGDRFSFTITGELLKSAGQGITGVDLFSDQDDLEDPWDTDKEVNQSGRSQDQKKFNVNMDLDLGFGDLTVVPSYSKRTEFTSETRTGMDGSTEDVNRDMNADEKGFEARIASSADSRIAWIAGFNYYKRHDESLSTGDTLNSYMNAYSDQEIKALYGNITYPLTDQFRTTAGVRQSWDESETYSGSYRVDMDTGVAEFEEDIFLSDYNNPDYKVGVEYDVAENSMLYANWATSYRSFGIAMKDSIKTDPEKLNAYTVGSKNRFLDNKLQVNASAYLYLYENYMPMWQNPDVWIDLNNDGIETRDERFRDPWGAVPTDFRNYGADIQTSLIISKKDILNFSVSYLKAYFPDLIIDYYYEQLEDVDFRGKEKTFSPHWTLNASYSHNFTLPNGGVITARIDARYQSDYNLYFRDQVDAMGGVVIDLKEYRIQEAFYKGDVSAVYAHPDGKWTLTAYVNNVTNYAEKLMMMVEGDGSGTMSIGTPRTYGAIISVRY